MASTKVTEKNLILVVSGDAKKAEKEMAKVRDAINASFKDPQTTMQQFGSMARTMWKDYGVSVGGAANAGKNLLVSLVDNDKGLRGVVDALKMLPGPAGLVVTAVDLATTALVNLALSERGAEEELVAWRSRLAKMEFASNDARAAHRVKMVEKARGETLDAETSWHNASMTLQGLFYVAHEAGETAHQDIVAGIADKARKKAKQKADEDAEKARARQKVVEEAMLVSDGKMIQRWADKKLKIILDGEKRIAAATAERLKMGVEGYERSLQEMALRAQGVTPIGDNKGKAERDAQEAEREALRNQDPWEALAKGSKSYGAEIQVLQSSFEGLGQVAGQAFQAILTGNESVSAAGLLDAFLESIGMEFQMLAIKEAGLAIASAFVPGMQAAAAGHAAAAAIFQGGAIAAGLGARAIDSGGGGVPGGGAGGGANDAGRASSSGSGGNTVVENHYNLGWGFFGDEKRFIRETDRMRREAESDGSVPPAGKRGPGGRRR